MLRTFVRTAFFLVAAAAMLESSGRGQPAATADRVFYRDKKDGQIKDVEAELKASPTGYQIISATDKKLVATVSASDIIRVVPADIPGFDRKAIFEPVGFETKKDWEKARLAHVEIAKKSGTASEKVRKYLEFRTAICLARSSDETPDESAATAKGHDAIKLLDNFLTANKTGWEVFPVGQSLARLQVSSTEIKKEKDGDKEVEKDTGRRMFEEAARTWGKVAKTADLAADLKQEAVLQEIDTKLRARQLAEAKGLIDEAMKTAPAGAVKDRLNIFQLAQKFGDNPNPAEGATAIEAEIAKSKDPLVRATGYGMIGELYLAADKPRDAMWNYLTVEVVYNQDRDEVIKAVARLADIFRTQGEEDRGRTYREKLRRLRGAP